MHMLFLLKKLVSPKLMLMTLLRGPGTGVGSHLLHVLPLLSLAMEAKPALVLWFWCVRWLVLVLFRLNCYATLLMVAWLPRSSSSLGSLGWFLGV